MLMKNIRKMERGGGGGGGEGGGACLIPSLPKSGEDNKTENKKECQILFCKYG